MRKNAYLIALFLLAFSGLLLHLRIHPFIITNPNMPSEKVFNFSYFLATLLPLIDVVFVTILFSLRKTAVYGYLLNGLIVIYGTVLMAHFSINQMIAKNLPIQAMFLRSTLPDIGIAWGDFFVGKALYDLYMKGEIS
jgi:hypothetical protein